MLQVQHTLRMLAVGLVLAVAIALPPAAAEAAIFQVTKTTDTADGLCDADCSLREALIAANAAPDPDTVRLSPGVHRLSREGIGEDAALTGDLDIRAAVAIRGSGAKGTTVTGAGVDRVFHSPAQPRSFTASISGLTVTGGGNEDPFTFVFGGGGIAHQARAATLNLGAVVVRRNRATYAGGVPTRGR